MMPIERDYELFFAVFQFPDQAIYLNRLNGWRKRCRKAACYLAESWTTMLSTSRAYYRILSDMDCIFTHSEVSARALTKLLGRPCHFLPFAVDALRFCPAPAFLERSIDVLAVGRHAPRVHSELVRLSQEDGLFYHYDTAQPFRVKSYVEHRRMLAELCKRARFTLTYKHNVDMTSLTGGDESLAPRFFEAAAAGSVLLGIPPDCEDFRECFDWKDAVIDFPFDGGDVRGILSELLRHPERLAAARSNNVAQSLRRHDWAHRWMQVLAQAGLSSMPAMQQRLSRMSDLADGIQPGVPVNPGDDKQTYAILTHRHNSRPNLGVATVS
jgi:hypothetical protein